MNGTVSVYFNTGFNGVDIPTDPSVLELCPKKVYPDVYYVREDIDKPSIKIKDTYDNLCNVDYCKIETSNKTCYYFAAPTALAQGVTQLSLDLDALLTMGGAKNLHYISGWQERGHITKAEDQLFHNVASEAWTPSNPLRASNLSIIEGDKTAPGESKDIVVTNIDMKSLKDLETDAMKIMKGIVEGDLDPKMYLPKLETPTREESTLFSVWDFDDTPEDPNVQGMSHAFVVPGTAAYDLSDDGIRTAVGKLFSAGQLQLQASYTIPYMYLGDRTQLAEDGHYTRVDGYHWKHNARELPFVYNPQGYTVKNKKCLETYRSFVIVNLGSGDMCIKSPHEIYNPDYPTTSPVIRLWADPTSTGKPYARFDYIRDNPLQWTDAVKGLQWANAQLSLEGASGSMWNSISAAFQSQNIERAKEQSNYDTWYSAQFNKLSRDAAQLGMESALWGNNNARIGAIANTVESIPGAMANLHMSRYGSKASSRMRGTSGFSSNIGSTTENAIQFMTANFNDDMLRRQYDNQMEGLFAQREQMAENARLEIGRLRQQLNENGVELYKNNNVVAPTLMFTPEQNLGLYGYNKFAIYEVRKDDDDLKSEDMYYQRFGYSGLHRPLTAECFNARQYYSYVQAFDVNLEAAEPFGLRVRQKAITQLNSGVRVWKVVPNPSYYESN